MSYSGISRRGGSCEPFCMPRLDQESCALSADQGVRSTLDELEREAFERGFAQGEKAGFAMGEHKAGVLLDKVQELLRDLCFLRDGAMRDLEAQAVELSMAIARKVILREVAQSPEIILDLTREALGRMEKTGQITVRTHPAVLDLFEKHRPELLSIHPDMVFSVDSSVSPYGTVICGLTEEAVVEVDEQLRVISEELRGARGKD